MDIHEEEILEEDKYPLLGFLLVILKCTGAGLSPADEFLLRQTKQEICEIINLMFDMALNTRLIHFLKHTQQKMKQEDKKSGI